MKKLFCAVLAALMCCCATAALAEYCMYGYPESPCAIYWCTDAALMRHRYACMAHADDSSNEETFVTVLDWAECTVDENNACTVCGYDYDQPAADPEPDVPIAPPDNDALLLTTYLQFADMYGEPPVECEAGRSASQMRVRFTDFFISVMDEVCRTYGVTPETSLSGSFILTLKVPEDVSYESTGEAICPEVFLEASGEAAGQWLLENGLVVIHGRTFRNNVEPGQAEVTADVAVAISPTGFTSIDLTATFTITAAKPRIPGDADDSGEVRIQDVVTILASCSGAGTEINRANAEVTGDGTVDLYDVLLIMQYVAGWNVTLQ